MGSLTLLYLCRCPIIRYYPLHESFRFRSEYLFSGEQRSLPSLSTLPLDNLRSPDLFNVVNGNTLIGTTSERQILINDIQNSFVESLHADIDKERENHVEERRREEQTKMSEDATRLMNERKNRVLPEPNMDEDVTSLSV